MHLTQTAIIGFNASSLGLIMFGGEFLTSFVPEVGVQEQMREHGKDPLWKIKYEQQNLLLVKILFSVRSLSRYREINGETAAQYVVYLTILTL